MSGSPTSLQYGVAYELLRTAKAGADSLVRMTMPAQHRADADEVTATRLPLTVAVAELLPPRR